MIDACLIDERVEGGRIQLQVEKSEICELVESTADLLRPAAGNRKFGMILPDDPVMAAVDSRLMEMALSNVLDNAVKYSPDGSTITLSVEEVRNGVEIVIADQGPVIAEAERSRIFEKYYRSDATSQVKGSGLGLHLVRSILEAHDGTATCEPTPEAGNRFILRFPASPKSPGR
jgi:K+-sensing histidine kinase KdpD